MKNKLSGFQKQYLRGLAHPLRPFIQIGKSGLTAEVLSHIGQTFQDHELIKIKFNDFREEKKTLAAEIEKHVHCIMVGMIGNTAVFFREHPDREKRKISLPG
jgi:RNA-binding protein